MSTTSAYSSPYTAYPCPGTPPATTHAGSATMGLHFAFLYWTFYFYFLGPHLDQQYPSIPQQQDH